jgi:hypothetical protein
MGRPKGLRYEVTTAGLKAWVTIGGRSAGLQACRAWQSACSLPSRAAVERTTTSARFPMTGRNAWTQWILLGIAIVAMFAAVRASNKDETIVTVQVSSADHELMEGYFTLGDNLTLMAKPGSEVHRFLARQRGRKVKISLAEASAPAPSRLER